MTFAVDDLAPHTFVEAHLLFPKRLLADAQTTAIKILPSRLATEAELAAQANEQRVLARAAVAAERRGRVIAWTVSGVVTAAALVVLVRPLLLRRTRVPVALPHEVPA